eukprot:CFRG7506T1
MLAGGLLSKFNPKPVLILSLVANIGFALLFALAPNTTVLLIARFFVGTTQAFMTIYGPVWVDEFAPTDLCTTWMAFIQSGVPIGIVVGYVTAGYMTANGLDVSISFYCQVAALAPLTLLLCCVPTKYIDTNACRREKRARNQSHNEREMGMHMMDAQITNSYKKENWKKFKESLGAVFHNRVYIMCTSGLCSLYFVVTGLQMWITEYLTIYLKQNKNVVVTAFSAVCATAPICGVLVGGHVLDRWGGYKGPSGAVLATRTSTILGICSVCFALIFVLVDIFGVIIFTIWMLLFLGGAIVPLATGVIVSSVPRHVRSFAASFSTMMYHLLGYFLGPTVVGGVADAFGGVEWGMRICMSASVFGVGFFGLAWYYAACNLADVNYKEEMTIKTIPFSDKKLIDGNTLDSLDVISIHQNKDDNYTDPDSLDINQIMIYHNTGPSVLPPRTARHKNVKKYADIRVQGGGGK